MSKTLWIGLGNVVAARDGQALATGEEAYVHLIGLGEDERDFLQLVDLTLREMGLRMLSLDEVDRLSDRQQHGHISDDLLKIATTVSEARPLAFGTFHSFDT